MRLVWLKAVALVVAAIMLPVAAGQGQAQETQGEQAEGCPFEKGWKSENLPRILEEHRKWVARLKENQYSEEWTKNHPEGRANLCNAYLFRADLRKANLHRANLTEARLNVANLSKAFLLGANLNKADLREADLAEAVLYEANLSKADLREANLSKVDLRGAYLAEAYVVLANLTQASLAFASLTNAVYAPASPPPDPYLEGVRGLSTVQFPKGSGSGLVQLRELLQKAGLRDLEREATYALESNKTSHLITGARKSPLNSLEGIFRLAAFEWTTGYGLYPGRALLIIVGFGVLLIPVYAWPIRFPPRSLNPVSGLYRIWPSDRIESAQPREYTLKPAGWFRLVSGLQSLLSVYLLAIWALTYFGRPFQ